MYLTELSSPLRLAGTFVVVFMIVLNLSKQRKSVLLLPMFDVLIEGSGDRFLLRAVTT